MTTAKEEFKYGSHRPEQYSKQAFRSAYRTHAGYDWFAAAQAVGIIGNEGEYIAECMHQYDMLSSTIDTQDIVAVRELGYDIIAEKRREIREMSKGRLYQRGKYRGTRRVEPFFEYTLDAPVPSEDDTHETVGTRIGEYDHGFDEVDDDGVMAERLALLKDALHPDDYEAVVMYTMGDAVSFRDACLQLGHTKTQYTWMRTRMRQHASVVRGFDAFA